MKASLFFTHIPKTAGTSLLKQMILPNYAPESIKHFRGIKDLWQSRKAPFEIMIGHSPYGMHHFRSGEVRYVTFLREPVERAISHYFFIKQPPRITGQQRMNHAQKQVHQTTDIEHIFRVNQKQKYRLTTSWLVDNMQTRYLAGYAYFALPKNSVLLLNRAKKNLRDRYELFGLKEAFDESVARFEQHFGWTFHPNTERSQSTRIEKNITESQREVVRANHLLDLELYEYARDLFKKG